MQWTPKQVNLEEVLDNPNIEIEVRKKLMLELDQTNIKYGTYAQYCRRFFNWLDSLNFKGDHLSILEIGSGSGGLAREILKSPDNHWKMDYSLMDQDPDILSWAQARLQDQQLGCKIFSSKERHLSQFSDKSFDVIISLHVIHHIHPLSTVQKMFQDSFRVAQLGFFHADFERRFGNVTMATVVNTLSGLSKDLNEDGVKSVKRSYTASEITESFKPQPTIYKTQVQRLFPFPHMIITGSAQLNDESR